MESNARICKRCKEIKERREVGRYPDGKNKIYLDKEGFTWVGSVCGPCHAKKMKKHMKQKRLEEKNIT